VIQTLERELVRLFQAAFSAQFNAARTVRNLIDRIMPVFVVKPRESAERKVRASFPFIVEPFVSFVESLDRRGKKFYFEKLAIE
jgi:hypothetical protein